LLCIRSYRLSYLAFFLATDLNDYTDSWITADINHVFLDGVEIVVPHPIEDKTIGREKLEFFIILNDLQWSNPGVVLLG
jgi:hypothetical protein